MAHNETISSHQNHKAFPHPLLLPHQLLTYTTPTTGLI